MEIAQCDDHLIHNFILIKFNTCRAERNIMTPNNLWWGTEKFSAPTRKDFQKKKILLLVEVEQDKNISAPTSYIFQIVVQDSSQLLLKMNSELEKFNLLTASKVFSLSVKRSYFSLLQRNSSVSWKMKKEKKSYKL